MDNEIINLVQAMNDVLSFVEEADTLRNKLTSLTETIQKILVVIQECSTSIYEYLNSSIAGMLFCNTSTWNTRIKYNSGQTWQAFSEMKQFSDYRSRISKLSSMMDSAAILHIAHNIDESFTERK